MKPLGWRGGRQDRCTVLESLVVKARTSLGGVDGTE